MSLIKDPEESLVTKETKSAHELFNYKKVFKEKDSVTHTGTALVDFRDVRQLYGKVDPQRHAIYISESRLTSLSTNNTSADVVLVADFVAEAFSGFREAMRRNALKKRVDPSGHPMFAVNPSAAWSSASIPYHEVMNGLYVNFFRNHIRRNKINEQIVDFNTFLKKFNTFVRSSAKEFNIPFTFTGFILNKSCSPMTSGLIIDIHDGDTNDDIVKKQLFLNNPSFKLFRETAKKFGFVIDKNIPWRLVADLSSIGMKKYMYRQGSNYRTVFKNYYHRAIDYDVDIMREYLIGFYNSLATQEPYIKKQLYCPGGRKLAAPEVIKRNPVDPEEIKEKYPDFFWIEQYLRFRIYETKSVMEDNDFQLANKKVKRMLRVFDISKVMLYIDTLVNKHSTVGAELFKQEKWDDFEYAPDPTVYEQELTEGMPVTPEATPGPTTLLDPGPFIVFPLDKC